MCANLWALVIEDCHGRSSVNYLSSIDSIWQASSTDILCEAFINYSHSTPSLPPPPPLLGKLSK